MKSKLTLEHIASFLPYGLKGLSGVKPLLLNKEIWELVGVKPMSKGFEASFWGVREDYKNIIAISAFKPILRRMDLTKPITIDGVEKIPIVELANIAFNSDWKIYNEKDTVYRDCYGIKEYFTYSDNSFYRYTIDGGHISIQNQLKLFQWLYENKFNIDIPDELVIYTDTLETDPYNT